MEFETVTDTVSAMLVEIIKTTGIIFSRRSLMQKEIMIEFGFDPWKVNRTLKRFKRNGLINERNTRNESFQITKKGLTYLRRHEINAIEFTPNPRTWDGMWRVLIFDIPERERFLRNELRRKIISWNFKKLQQSVFVTPYNCEKELFQLCEVLNVQHYIHLIKTSSMENIEQDFLRYYGLRK